MTIINMLQKEILPIYWNSIEVDLQVGQRFDPGLWYRGWHL